MKIDYNEISERIEELLKNGVKTRNKILNEIISEDEELNSILELCKKSKGETEIMIELKKPIEIIRKDINTLETINKLADSKIASMSAKKFYTNKVVKENMPHGTNEELKQSITKARKNEIHKKSNARKFLNNYFLEYMSDKKNEINNKNKWLKDLSTLEKNVDLLGSQTSDVLYLVSIYIDVGYYKKADSILKIYDPKDLTEIQRKNYHVLNDRAKRLRNQHFINNLIEMGCSPQQIYDLCEKEVSEYRAPYLDLKFIASMLEKRFRKVINKSDNVHENNINKKEENDELEL